MAKNKKRLDTVASLETQEKTDEGVMADVREKAAIPPSEVASDSSAAAENVAGSGETAEAVIPDSAGEVEARQDAGVDTEAVAGASVPDWLRREAEKKMKQFQGETLWFTMDAYGFRDLDAAVAHALTLNNKGIHKFSN